VLAYGQTREEAVARVEGLALQVLEETNRREAPERGERN